jgi:hypothetical protein
VKLPARSTINLAVAAVQARRIAMPTIMFRRKNPGKRDVTMAVVTMDLEAGGATRESHSGDFPGGKPAK